MRKTALAKTVDPQEALEAARMHDLVVGIIMAEFIGDLATGIWLAAAQRAADRIMEAIGGVTLAQSDPIPAPARPSERAKRP
jgi:hypothetical protein